ncbi:hypothetical protein [Natrinema halophilum]|uniref:hypothetical protein n=1 Tax=Natrinema halophilum TaxID=1699371 RepID=UPI001F4538FA|nr:hypothetical protein [Natrinema halophilum]UHQ96406.1 hypothetical protein HYG82_23485 [Natrinema halophilum]
MSATSTSSDRYECDHCGDYAPSYTFFDAAMCSESCRRAADAESILNTLTHDHTTCGTCFRRLKVIEKPPERAPSAAIGFQFRTENATWGEKRRPTGPKNDEPELPSLTQQVYAYEVQDDDNDELREYYPGRRYDRANEPEPTPKANEPVRTGTVCDVCGNTEHNVPDPHLRSNCSTMLVGHFFTERVRELDKTIDEQQFWSTYSEADRTIRDALEAAVII